ncbi:MAG TPA: translational GTPase TypA [Bacteroidales bacterium]|nr:translational GTPase TypA [Bacteroidales bacterium]
MEEIRNIAVIAHVDHGKTTLVDRMLYQVKLFRDNQKMGELILDSNELEKERGITILSKNVSVRYKNIKINIIDTPGHADFGGEVERVLNMAEGILLIVDAFEGPMPQTRFVLQKALELGLKPIVVINKVDKPNCKPEEVQENVFDLMYSLKATEDQLDFPTVFGSAKQGWMGPDWNEPTSDVSFLLDTIIRFIPPAKAIEGSLQMRISSLDYSSYMGRIAVGKIKRGSLIPGSQVSLIKRDGRIQRNTVKEVYLFEGLGKEKTKKPVRSGEICAIFGMEDFDIGDTIADSENPEALPLIKVDEPTMSMIFATNTSPFYGQEGTLVTSRQLRERLFRETEKNLAMRIEETDSTDGFIVYGRGILHLSILIETMRREGFELQVGQPTVLTKEINGIKHEPVEVLTIQTPESFASKVIDQVTQRKGEILSIEINNDRARLDFKIPSRGIIGLRNQILTATEGEAVIAHRFDCYEPWKGEMTVRRNGSLIAMETGTVASYALDKLKDRGKFFVLPGEEVYMGQVIGEYTRQSDITVNVIKTKKLTNMRASGSDDKIILAPPVRFSLEEAMEYIAVDEYIEVTPKSMRLRKISLDENNRKK